MKVLQLKYITEKGKIAINKENEKSKKDRRMLFSVRATGGRITFIDGGMEFQHFIFKNMTGDLNSASNEKSERMKKLGFQKIIETLSKDGCELDIDYSINFIDKVE